MRARGAADWRLRTALLGGLLALVMTAGIVQAMPPAVQANKSQSQTAPYTPVIPPRPTSAPTLALTPVPGAVTGFVSQAHAAGSCGFALLSKGPAAPVGQCTVLEIGDSLGNDLGWGLQREVAAGSGITLVQADTSSTGLANSAFYDWPAVLAADLKKYHPQLVLISLGGNDEQGMDLPGGPVQFPSAAWQTAYLARVTGLVNEAVSSGAYVLWVGMPIMGPPSYNQGMQILDSLYQESVSSEPNATFVSTWSLFSNPQGAFQSTAVVNGQSQTVREPDGIHYSYAGENVLATYVLQEMALIYHVQLSPQNPAQITSWQ